jgi:diguanylate cyclase (GGDEF)-like protein/PAS domain S-box-containing protein
VSRHSIFFHTLFKNLPDAVAVLNMRGRIISVNPEFEKLFGYTLKELRGTPLAAHVVPERLSHEASELLRRVLSSDKLRAETTRRSRDGKLLPVEIHAFPIMVKGRQVGAYLVYVNVSKTRNMSRRAVWQATHDDLTGLINRVEFERRLTALLPRIAGDTEHGLLYIDLDEFKLVNDICGHCAGDALLRELTTLIAADIGDSGILARLGGDEFGVLLNQCTEHNAERLARKLMRTIAAFRFVWDDRTFKIGASIGVVGIDANCRDLPELFAAADAACYSAKGKGGNRVRVYRREDADIAHRRDQMDWASRLSEALESDGFLLYHQVISPLKSSDGARWYEILLRFRAEGGEIVTPYHFISAAERYHLMPALDRWVVRKVFAGIRRELHARGAGLREVIAINISGETLGEAHFRQFVRKQFRRFKVPPRMICFEITETAAIENLDQAIAFIDDMRTLGCTISLDDFGSGLSSFPYLKTLHVDYLKIDGAFVRNMAEDAIDCAMVETINRVGKIMGVKTIAEYVEVRGVLKKLGELGVDFAQGYDIHVPERWLPGLT